MNKMFCFSLQGPANTSVLRAELYLQSDFPKPPVMPGLCSVFPGTAQLPGEPLVWQLYPKDWDELDK